MLHPTTTPLTPEQIRDNLAAAYSYMARARQLLRKAKSDDEHESAAWWVKNASGEIARWQQAERGAR
jgi:hypothetical protein